MISRGLNCYAHLVQVSSQLSGLSKVDIPHTGFDYVLMESHRGTIGSYQMWADKVEDQSFTFDNVLPNFQRSP